MRTFIVILWFIIYTIIYSIPKLNDLALGYLISYHQTYDMVSIVKMVYPFVMIFMALISSIMTWIKFKQDGLTIPKNSSFVSTVGLSLVNVVFGYISLSPILFLLNKIMNINDVYISFSPFVLALQLLVFSNIADFYHYYVHRWIFHSKLVYKYIHSLHHKLREPYAWGTIYCHPIEHVFFNMILIALPTICAKFNAVSLVFALLVAVYGTCMDHSGLKTKFFEYTAIKHKNHHLYVSEEYGVYFTDRLFGTEHSDTKIKKLKQNHKIQTNQINQINQENQINQINQEN
jgi:sterol desaturase/sphingolipid hydroxylase (fatty acid hydroxylase superfamily)